MSDEFVWYRPPNVFPLPRGLEQAEKLIHIVAGDVGFVYGGIAHTHWDGEKLVVREITAEEFYASPPDEPA